MTIVMRAIQAGAICLSFLLFATGCSIYRDLDEPPREPDDAGVADVQGEDAPEDEGASDSTENGGDSGDCVPVGDPDEADVYCAQVNANCGDIVVVDDCGTEHNVNCGSCDSGGRCSGGATNFPRACVCDCVIDGQCYTEGDVNPGNPCQVCDAANDMEWSDAPQGTRCDDGDELLCTGFCESGTCVGEPRDDACVIDGSCITSGDENPANDCEICEPQSRQDAWTVDEGSQCGGNSNCSCTADAMCLKSNDRDCD